MIVREPSPQEGSIIGLFPELLGVGGVQEAGRLTAAALQGIAAAHNTSAEFLSLNDAEGSHSFDLAGRSVPFRGFGRAKLRFVLSAMARILPLAKNPARILLAAHPNLAVPAAGSQLASPRLKTIVVAHGVEVWKPLPPYRRHALRRATCVLAPSRDTVQKLIAVQGASPQKIRALPWPLNPEFLRMAAEPARLPLPPAYPNGRVILAVGRWSASERYKGIDELLHAVAQLRSAHPDLHVVAVGGGDDLPRLRHLSADLGVTHIVHFLQNLSREQIASCYAHADIFALPSTGEGFGLVFLEAMAFAKPVIGVAAGGATDIVEDEINGLLVPPRDTAALGRAVSRLLRDETLSRELGRRGAEIVLQKYQFNTFLTGLERILAECGLHERSANSIL